jgi:uncharacterized membrane protein YhdT
MNKKMECLGLLLMTLAMWIVAVAVYLTTKYPGDFVSPHFFHSSAFLISWVLVLLRDQIRDRAKRGAEVWDREKKERRPA